MNSRKIIFSVSFIVILAMALSACAPENQMGISNVSGSGKVTAVSVSMDQLELGQTFFVGQVTSVAKDAVTIDDVVFRIDQNSFMPVGLTVGDVVSVDGIVLPDQTRYVVQMEMRSVADISSEKEGLEFKLYGLVEKMELSTWVISGETINVSQNAMIEPGIQIGDVVEVEGYLVNGTMRAYEITKEDSTSSGSSASEHEYEFYGLVESLGTNKWVIDGKTVEINNQTELKGTFSLGDLVKVHVLKTADGQFTAREIEHESEVMGNNSSGEHQSGENEVEFKGFVEEIQAGMWVVAGITVIFGDNFSVTEDIQVGDYVEVEGTQQDDGSVLAYKIALESPDDGSDDDGSDDSSDDDGSGDDSSDDGSGDDSSDDDSSDDDSSDDGSDDDGSDDGSDDDSSDDGSDDDSSDDDSSDDDSSDDDSSDDDSSDDDSSDDDSSDDDSSDDDDSDDDGKSSDD
jgi:hypothetical protein